MVLLETIVSIVMNLLIWPMILFSSAYMNNFNDEIKNITERISWALYVPFGFGIIFTEACRYWLMYYQINYFHSSQNLQWKNYLNENFINTNWYLKNKKTFGSFKYVSKKILIYYLINTIIIFILFITFGFHHFITLIDGTLYAVPILFILFLYWKCPVFHDKFYFYCTCVIFLLLFVFQKTDCNFKKRIVK